ncbi:MAG TPA: hypothetical protein VGI85_06380 [Chthoniobacterales bacterium]|jgi:hypothetical protein
MINGLRTAADPAPDLAKAKPWHESVFQRKPSLNEPFYVSLDVGGFELGLVPDLTPGAAGAKALWGVHDIAKEVEELHDLGCDNSRRNPGCWRRHQSCGRRRSRLAISWV